jgi:hypothetical protein
MTRWLAGGFLIAFLAIGVPYWQIPYNKLDLSHVELVPGIIVLGLATLLVSALGARPGATLMVMLLCVPAVDMVAIVRDVAADPTSHNLAPLELAMLLVAGAVVVMPSLGIGLILRALLRRRKPPA